MEHAVISIVSPLSPPPEQANFVMFCSPRNYTPEYDTQKMLSAASRYAKKYGVYLVPERFSANKNLCLCLISPKGTPLGVQQACHLNMDYRGVFRRADRIEPVDTPFGKIALLVDVDINMPQACRGAVQAGAQLLIASQFIHPFDFNEQRVSYSVLNASLSNSVPVAAAVASGGIIVRGDALPVADFSEYLPVTGALIPSQWRVDHEGVAAAQALLREHRQLLTDETGGTANA